MKPYHQKGSANMPIILALIIIVISIISAIFILPKLAKSNTTRTETQDTPQNATSTNNPQNPLAQQNSPHKTHSQKLAAKTYASPKALINQIVQTIKADGIDGALAFIPKNGITHDNLNHLKSLAVNNQLNLSSTTPMQEIGELLQNRAYRWAINFDNSEATRLILDLVLESQNSWKVQKAYLDQANRDYSSLSEQELEQMDGLQIARLFVDSVISQDFNQARQLTEPGAVSNSKIAALCILFEEGNFKLRENKPIRLIYQRPTVSAYIAKVVTLEEETAGEFGLILSKTNQWKVSEVNIDSLISEYTKRFVDDDVYYSPLVTNPQGGDTLALFFAYDENSLTIRTQKQLQIVSNILKLSSARELIIHGHTDSKGSDSYNDNLSIQRALAVKETLVSFGVPHTQIIIKGLGENVPIMPNINKDGSDNPLGRQKNRRAEILLDF